MSSDLKRYGEKGSKAIGRRGAELMFFTSYQVAIIIVVSVIFSSCRNDISEIRAITDPQNVPVQTNHNARYSYTEGGKLRFVLSATILHRYAGEESFLEAGEGFSIVFYDSIQQEEARLKAVNGRYDDALNKLTAWEKVELTNARGEKLETEELIFLQDSSLIRTDKFVTITTTSGVIYGRGLESNDSFTKYRILNPTGNIFVSDESDKSGNGKNP